MTRAARALALLTAAAAWPLPAAAGPQAGGQTSARPPDVEVEAEIVQTVGCVERRPGAAPWWLTRAAEPTVTRAGVFNRTDVDEARTTAPGSAEFELVGVPDFLGAEALLRSADRALFTTPDQVNATGELREHRRVLVKGLLIDADAGARINLLAVVGLADGCADGDGSP